MQKSTEKIAKSPKFCTLAGNRGRRIERRCLNLHRKFINNRFCACAVQMFLKMAVNAAICSTFEVQYGKSASVRTTTLRNFGHLKQITWFRACAESHTFLTGRALFSQITIIIFIVVPPKLYSEYSNRFSPPILTGHVIWRTRSGRVRIFNGNQRKTLKLVTHERIVVGSSNLVAGLATWPAMYDNCLRSKCQRSRSPGHVTYQQTKTL